jgi:hypothetical protein
VRRRGGLGGRGAGGLAAPAPPPRLGLPRRLERPAGAEQAPKHPSSAATSSRRPRPPPRRRYRKLLLGVDLSKQFFFSGTYCLANTLQRNHDVRDGQDPNVYGSMFVWNSHLTRCGAGAGAGQGAGGLGGLGSEGRQGGKAAARARCALEVQGRCPRK